MNVKTKPLLFFLGLLIGTFLFNLISIGTRRLFFDDESQSLELLDSKVFKKNNLSLELYESKLADVLQNEVKIVCWINIAPKYHKTKAIHIKNTWGRRCNLLLFMSHEDDINLPAIKLDVEEGLDHFWKKFKLAFKYVYEHHLADGDYFLKADGEYFFK